MFDIIIRFAQEKDIARLLDIYNYEVEHGVATLDLHRKELPEWKSWFEDHQSEQHPLIVAVSDDMIAGYASLSPYREKEAYISTVELSVYIAPEYRGMGIASKLMKNILTLAQENRDIHLVVSVITSGNKVSEKLHRKFGFTYCGTLHEVGMKMGRYLDIDNYELSVRKS